MKKWLDDTFGIDRNIDGAKCFRFTFVNRETEVRLDIFLVLFGEVDAPPTYDDFIDADPDNNAGWHKYFDDWKQRDILN